MCLFASILDSLKKKKNVHKKGLKTIALASSSSEPFSEQINAMMSMNYMFWFAYFNLHSWANI